MSSFTACSWVSVQFSLLVLAGCGSAGINDSNFDGLASCIAAHGRGVETADHAVVVKDEAFDNERYISRHSAECVAMYHGLAPGIGSLRSEFNYADGKCYWNVENVLRVECKGQYPAAGDAVLLDALNGNLIATGDWHARNDCSLE